MSPTGFSVPAARISIMVNMAYLLGKGAISPEQYNIVSSFIEGTDTITSSKQDTTQVTSQSGHERQSEFYYLPEGHVACRYGASDTSPGGSSAPPTVSAAGPLAAE